MRLLLSLCAFWGSLAIATPAALLGADVDTPQLRVSCDLSHPADGIQLVNRLTSGSLTLSSSAPEFQFETFNFGGPGVAPWNAQ